jgi:hypothetical protein
MTGTGGGSIGPQLAMVPQLLLGHSEVTAAALPSDYAIVPGPLPSTKVFIANNNASLNPEKFERAQPFISMTTVIRSP